MTHSLRHSVLAAAMAALLPSVAQAGPACLVQHAHYILRGRPDVTADFKTLPKGSDAMGNVGIHIHFAHERDQYWWFFDRGSARYMNMISTMDFTKPGWRSSGDGPHGALDSQVWFADAHYNLNLVLPELGRAAPRHIFVSDLEEVMWYRADPRRGVPTAFFDLTTCR